MGKLSSTKQPSKHFAGGMTHSKLKNNTMTRTRKKNVKRKY